MASPDDDQDLFTEAMSRVRPIAAPDKVHVEKKPAIRNRTKSRSQRRSLSGDAVDGSSPSVCFQPQDEPWKLVANGVSRERIKRLAAGNPPIDLSIDLHGMFREQALGILDSGFQEACEAHMRVVCIVHGRGLHSQDKPVLKEATWRWLREGAYASRILAAIPQPGSGGGACLVLLRKT